MLYRERRLARLFNTPGAPNNTILKIGSTGPACKNLCRALRVLQYPVSDTNEYNNELSQAILLLQDREGHTSVDGLTGPGTRELIVKLLLRKGGERIFSHFDFLEESLFPTVFVSYAREDRREVEQVLDMLSSEGVNTWVDYKDLNPGEKWEQAIEQAIPRSRYFLAMLSRFTLSKKGFVQKEVKTAWAVADHYPESEIFVIPVRLEACEVHETKFSKLNYIDLFPDPAKGVERLITFLAESG